MNHSLALSTALLLLATATNVHAVNVTFGTTGTEFSIEFVEIGDAGNVADPNDGASATPGVQNLGAVSYDYWIGKYEISEDMINKANTLGSLGITHNGRGVDKPGTSISWYEAATFVNWLNTSSGGIAAYKFDMVGGTFALWESGDAGYDSSNRYRNSFAKYWLPDVDEWYKAAYYDPVLDIWYDYPTGSDAAPTPTAGSTTAGEAVYDGQAGPADITNAGGLSPFGTMGQGGNIWEWEETAWDFTNTSATEQRTYNGGRWALSTSLNSATRHDGLPTQEALDVGFRVAGLIPEPSRALLSLLGLGVVLVRRRR